jgi:hypothetical protein
MIADPLLFAFRLPETAAMEEGARVWELGSRFRSLFTTWRGTRKKYVWYFRLIPPSLYFPLLYRLQKCEKCLFVSTTET